jgi:hypothetical protein
MKKLFFCIACVLVCLSAALQADQWYLITESELLSIEVYKTKSAASKRSWLSLVQTLRADSANLNAQLQIQRELNRRLTQSFNEYEAAQSELVSLKNGKIALLEKELNDQTLVNEKLKGQCKMLWATVIAWCCVALAVVVSKFLK